MTETATRPVEELSFEEALKELEQVVDRLERGDVPLEESIRLYERGHQLKKHCEARLREAEEKIELITLDAEGRPTGLKEVEAP